MFDKRIWQSSNSISSEVRPFIVPLVPTGMNIGRSTGPWGRTIVEQRTFLYCLWIVNLRVSLIGESVFRSFFIGGCAISFSLEAIFAFFNN